MMLIEILEQKGLAIFASQIFLHGGFACQFNFAIENQGYQFPGEFDFKTVGIIYVFGQPPFLNFNTILLII